MQEVVFQSSRSKTALALAGSLTFVGLGVWMSADAGWADVRMNLVIAFFGLCAVIFLTLVVRPQRLTLDAQGFTLSGGLTRAPKRTLWSDVGPFSVFQLPRGGKAIGYNFAVSKDGIATRFASRMTDFDASLPKLWPGRPQEMVDQLNAYRSKALDKSRGGAINGLVES